jgi:hypothetical protein
VGLPWELLPLMSRTPYFEEWRDECEAIHKEMDRLLAAGRSQTSEARQVRQVQFMALVERRNEAARNLLKQAASPMGPPPSLPR